METKRILSHEITGHQPKTFGRVHENVLDYPQGNSHFTEVTIPCCPFLLSDGRTEGDPLGRSTRLLGNLPWTRCWTRNAEHAKTARTVN